jgi:hypothetical protein
MNEARALLIHNETTLLRSRSLSRLALCLSVGGVAAPLWVASQGDRHTTFLVASFVVAECLAGALYFAADRVLNQLR